VKHRGWRKAASGSEAVPQREGRKQNLSEQSTAVTGQIGVGGSDGRAGRGAS